MIDAKSLLDQFLGGKQQSGNRQGANLGDLGKVGDIAAKGPPIEKIADIKKRCELESDPKQWCGSCPMDAKLAKLQGNCDLCLSKGSKYSACMAKVWRCTEIPLPDVAANCDRNVLNQIKFHVSL